MDLFLKKVLTSAYKCITIYIQNKKRSKKNAKIKLIINSQINQIKRGVKK